MKKPSDAHDSQEPKRNNLHNAPHGQNTTDTAKSGDGASQHAHKKRPDAPENSETETRDAAEQGTDAVSVEQLQEEIQRKDDEIIRLNAEMDNIRKRNMREMENLRKYALDKFTKELLPVVDSMEKAMQVDRETTTVDQVLEGTELTQKILHKILQNHGLEVIDPLGEKFDPEQHEAVSAVENTDAQPNTVLDVFQKGYKLNGRVVRPAMVVVAK